MMEMVSSDKWYELVDFVEEHGGSLSGESRDRLWHIVTDENVVTVEPEPMDDDALMELFGNLKEQLELLTIKRTSPSTAISKAPR